MLDKYLKCPWCSKSVVYYDNPAEVTVTIRCCKCQHFYSFDLRNGTTRKIRARKYASTNVAKRATIYTPKRSEDP